MKKLWLFWLGLYTLLVAGIIAVFRFGFTVEAGSEFQRLTKPFHRVLVLGSLILCAVAIVLSLYYQRRKKRGR